MAEEITNAPLPTAEQITELVNSGQIAPETASLFAPAPVEPIMSEEIVPEPALEPVLEPTLEEQVQNTDFDQYDTTALQDEIIQEAAQPQDQLTQDVLASDIQDQPVDETDGEKIVAAAEVKKNEIMKYLSDLKGAEDAESLQRQKLIEEQEAVFADVADLKQAAKDTEVDDFWSDSSTGTKIMAALAIGLGAAAGVQRGDNQNQALQLINGIVNQQMKAKQQSFKNQLAVKSAVMGKVQAQLRVLDSKTASRQKSANIAVMMQGIQAEKDKLDTQLKAQVQKSALINKQQSQKLNTNEESALINSLNKEDRKRYIPGFGLAKDAEIAKKASETIMVGETVMEDLNKIKSLMSEYGSVEILDRGAVSSEEAVRKSLQMQFKDLFGLGVLQKHDMVLLEDFTGKDFFSPTTLESTKRAKIQAAENFVKGKVNAALRRSGLPSLGKSKLESTIEHFKKKGLTEKQATERYFKLVESGKLKP
jgi:hypothetical protein